MARPQFYYIIEVKDLKVNMKVVIKKETDLHEAMDAFRLESEFYDMTHYKVTMERRVK